MRIIVPTSLLLLLGVATAAPVPDTRPKEVIEKLEAKLVGEWVNGGACIGDITIQSNGTFERKHYSPGNNTLSGAWKVQWDALPPTLVLACDKSDHEADVGRTQEYKVVLLNDDSMNWESGGQTAGHFARQKEKR
jgi:hypothetical protein